MSLVTVEYRADRENRKSPVTFKVNKSYHVTLEPGLNKVAANMLTDLEKVNYFQQGVERRVFIVTKPTVSESPVIEPESPTKQPETTANSAKTPTTPKTTVKATTSKIKALLDTDDDDDL